MQPLAHLCCTQCRLQCIGLHPQRPVWTALPRERSFCLSDGDCAQGVLRKMQPVEKYPAVIYPLKARLHTGFFCLGGGGGGGFETM